MISGNDFLREYELIGWVVEFRWSPKNLEGKLTPWSTYWNYKIYNSEPVANDAIKMISKESFLNCAEFRTRKVFSKKIGQ